jgi:hypothetical protein
MKEAEMELGQKCGKPAAHKKTISPVHNLEPFSAKKKPA